jgi:hypothetical protein
MFPGSPPDDNDLGVGFTEIFVKRPDYVSLLLSLLEEYDNYVRFYTVQVLTILLTNRPQKLQEVCILSVFLSSIFCSYCGLPGMKK